MKIKKSVTIDSEIYYQILKQHPAAGSNFSKVANALLRSALRDGSRVFWQSEFKIAKQRSVVAQKQLQFLDALEKEHNEPK